MGQMSYSFEGEDRIAASLLRTISAGRYLDIGCAEPLVISNTYLFYKLGWRGIGIDARPELTSEWARERPGDTFISCLVDEEEREQLYWKFPDQTMNTCDPETALRYAERYPDKHTIEKRQTLSARTIWNKVYGVNSGPPDFVTIDVEGHELPTIKGLISKEWKPALVLTEAKNFNLNRSLEHPLWKLLCKDLEYSLVAKTPLNAFFIDEKNPIFSWIPKSITDQS